MGVITALRATPDGRAIRVEKDGAKWLRLPVHLVADLGLATGEEMDATRVAAIEDAAALERLWEATLRYTVARGRSTREVERRLRDRQATPSQAQRIHARLAANGLADEAHNARQRVERLAMKRWGSRRIRSEMLGVGFPHDITTAAVAEVLPEGHDAQVLAVAVGKGVPESARDRRRLADRLVRQGIPPDMVRQAIRPEDGAREERDAAAPEADELIRQVRRRYPGQATDQAERRRALAWLIRRGVGYGDALQILDAQ